MRSIPKKYFMAAIAIYGALAAIFSTQKRWDTTIDSSKSELNALQNEWGSSAGSLPLPSFQEISSPFPLMGADKSPFNLTVPSLRPLRPIDREQYTLRINAWRRPGILVQNVAYFSTCEGIAEIQIVWCDRENDPPKGIYNFSKKVKVDRRGTNSLNERYNLADVSAPTLGIIHIDDDDLFPCFTLDHIFFKWTYNPERLVALQPRKHDEDKRIYYNWSRNPKSTLEHLPRGRYTMALPTIGGVMHRDYLDWYMQYFPRPFFHDIARQFNCEDIALSFFITALTQGKPPLLGDFWAMKSSMHVTDYTQQESSAISANGKTHKAVRSNCTSRSIHEMGLDLVPFTQLYTNLIRGDPARFETNKGQDVSQEDWFQLHFEMGASSRGPSSAADAAKEFAVVPRHARLLKIVDGWKKSPKQFKKDTLFVKGKSKLLHKVY